MFAAMRVLGLKFCGIVLIGVLLWIFSIAAKSEFRGLEGALILVGAAIIGTSASMAGVALYNWARKIKTVANERGVHDTRATVLWDRCWGSCTRSECSSS